VKRAIGKIASIIGSSKNIDFKFVQSCEVYCHQKSNRALVAKQFNHAGLTADQPDGIVEVPFLDTDQLATSICSALKDCIFEPKFNYRDLKASDWPAYKKSGEKTIKKFETDFIRLHIRGVNESNLSFQITTGEIGDYGLCLKSSVGPRDDMGIAINHIVQKYVWFKNSE